jgi:hypothetical protein
LRKESKGLFFMDNPNAYSNSELGIGQESKWLQTPSFPLRHLSAYFAVKETFTFKKFRAQKKPHCRNRWPLTIACHMKKSSNSILKQNQINFSIPHFFFSDLVETFCLRF